MTMRAALVGWLLVLATGCGGSPPPAHPRPEGLDLLPAGGAEVDPGAAGWERFASGPDVLVGTTAVGPRTGAAAFVVDSATPDGVGCWYVELPEIEAGVRHRFHGYARGEDVAPGAVRLQAEAWRGGKGPEILASATVDGGTGWRQLAAELVPPPGATVRLAACLTGAGVARFDDVMLWSGDRPPIRLVALEPSAETSLMAAPGQLPLVLAADGPGQLPPDLDVTVRWHREGEPARTSEHGLAAPPLRVALPLDEPGLWQVSAELAADGRVLDTATRWIGVGLDPDGGAGAGAPVAPPTGAFSTAEADGRWYFVDPGGRRFLSLGVGQVLPHAEAGSKYTDWVRRTFDGEAHWALATARELLRMRFNTVGAISSRRLPGLAEAVQLDLGRLGTPLRIADAGAQLPDWLYFPDVFDPTFEERVDRLCRHLVPAEHDPRLLGYFTDNELGWWGLYAHTRRLPAEAPARQELERFLADAPPEPVELAWERHVAERYFSVVAGAVRRHDPRALVLGHRWAGLVPDHLLEVVGRHCDVVAVNYYNDGVPHVLTPELGRGLVEQGRGAGRPVLVAEWSFRGADTGHPNFGGAAPVLLDQHQRAEAAAVTAAAMLANPWVVGHHWFRWVDIPAEGIDQGGAREDGNYGLVAEDGRPWAAVQEALRVVNAAAYEVAAHARLGAGPAASWRQPASLAEALASPVPTIEAPWAGPLLAEIRRQVKAVTGPGHGHPAARALVLPPYEEWTASQGAIVDHAVGAPAPPSLKVERSTVGGAGWRSPAVPVEPATRVWLAGRFRADGVARGHETYFHRAVVAVEFLDRAGARVWHQDLLRADGTFDWRFETRPFLVPPGAAAARVHVQLIESAGTFWADDLTLAMEPLAGTSR